MFERKAQDAADLAQQALQLRINKANADIKKVLNEHNLAVAAEMVYTPQGIFAKPVLVQKPEQNIEK